MEMFTIFRRAIMLGWMPVAAIGAVSWFATSDEPGRALPAAYAPAARTPAPGPDQPRAFVSSVSMATNNFNRLDGEYECVVSNLTTGEGPYPLQCEKEGDEIVISFLDGDYFVVDVGGYHASSAEQWKVELD